MDTTGSVSAAGAAAELLARRRARLGLLEFAGYTNSAYQPAEHHRLIAEALERVARGEVKRLMICMPPRHGKSELASRRFPAWYLGGHPLKHVIAASYNSDLANDFGREVRNIVASPEFQTLFAIDLAADSKAANRWHTDKGGMYVAAGVGTAITGRGADILLIDDPFKDRAEADSELKRNSVWDWYTSTAYTRLMPGGAIVLINCMVGGTQVLMADGECRALREVRPGDEVASYVDGKLCQAAVLNWVNHGPDSVYEIRTTSGTIAKANERHPFLVDRGGVLEWIRLKNLRVGDRLIRASIGASGEGCPAGMQTAHCQLEPRAIANHTTTKQDGQAGTERLRSMPRLSSQRTCGTDTGSTKMNTERCLPSKMASAQFAMLSMGQHTGEISCASIMTTIPAKSEGCCANTAMWLLEKARQPKYLSAPLSTYEITHDPIVAIAECGREDVYDIQVAGTENFIANGLVSHNTRWHDDDLSGRLLAAQESGGDRWDVISLPAILDGKALWPAWYPMDRLEQIRAVLPARDWNSLYQQNPIPDDGDFFKGAWFGEFDVAPDSLRIYGASDYAVTDGGGDYTVHGVFGIDDAGTLYVLDWWRKQTSADVWIDSFCDLISRHQPLCWFGEAGPIRRAVEPFMRARMIERGAICRIEWLASISDKATRARSFQALASMGKVLFPKRAPWLADVLGELLRFPAGKNDDSVDVCSLMGRGLQFVRSTRKPVRDRSSEPEYVAVGWMG